MSASCNQWNLSDIRHEQSGRGERVSAFVGDERVWIETEDAKLAPRTELFASVFLLPALHHGVSLRVQQPVDRTWLRNADFLGATFGSWWGYPPAMPVEAEEDAGGIRPSPGTATCFTCGADSFHALLTAPYAIDALVFAQGFDIPLDDSRRMKAHEESMRRVADAYNKRAIFLRTNIRHHPYFASVPWKYAHGGALAAIGHVLTREFGSFIIPASYSMKDSDKTWGSHWLTDPYYSSSLLKIIHYGAAWRKPERLARIADNPHARNELRVCWKNLAPTGNCSRCEKCVRTMLYLACVGKLETFEVFDLSVPLADRVDALDAVKTPQRDAYRRMLDAELPDDVKEALQRLLSRSH